MVERVVAHQCGLMKQVPPLHRTLWGWRGVRVGEASNPGPVETRSADQQWQAIGMRSPGHSRWQSLLRPLAIAADGQFVLLVSGDRRLWIQMRPPSPHTDVPATILDALEADLQTIPASTVPASSCALAFHDSPFVASTASTVPASSAAVRGMHVVPVVSMSEGGRRGHLTTSPTVKPPSMRKEAPTMTQRVSDVNLTSKASSHQRGQWCLGKSLSSVLLPAHEVS